MNKKLTARFVQTKNTPGKYGDRNGTGLFLLVKKSGRKSYVQRITIRGKVRDIGLGSTRFTSLAEAREQAFENKKLALAGGDPLALKKKPDVPTFAEAVEIVIGIHSTGWRDSGKTEKQWRASLRDYAMPRLGNMPLDRITSADVMAVLLPIWDEKRVTAKRVKQRIGAVMKWTIVEGYRFDDPAGPALNAALPKNGVPRKHMRALPYAEVGAALCKIKASSTWPCTKLAIEFLTSTASRSGEVRGAKWSEIDFEKKVWEVPASRMKSKLQHRVPLSDRALEILNQAKELQDGSGLIFSSATGKKMRDDVLSGLLRELNIPGTPHGMRTAFRSWCAETGQNREVAEECLAHVNPNKVEAAYQRSSLLELRRKVMQAWADYLAE